MFDEESVIEEEVQAVYKKNSDLFLKNKRRYDRIAQKFMDFKGMFDIDKSEVYGYQASDMPVAEYPTDEIIMSLSIQ